MNKHRTIKVADIDVGDRRREDYGNIEKLAASIEVNGLLQLPVVDKNDKLICGGRRLEAVKYLRWESVDVWDVGNVPPETLRRLELEENLERKDLTAYERSKNMADLAEAVAKEAKGESSKNGHSDDTVRSPDRNGRGQPSKPDSIRNVAKRMGVPRATIDEAKQHVVAAEKYPIFKSPGWSQEKAVSTAKLLDGLDARSRAVALEMISAPGIPPSDGFKVVRNFGDMTEKQREEIRDDFRSGDQRRVDRAVTRAAKVPPMPDARLEIFGRIVKEITAAIEYAPTDKELCRQLQALRKDFQSLTELVRRRDRDEAKAAGWKR